MANLIITIISIALVAVAALFGIYYGGQAYQSANIKAYAATIIGHVKQIEGAYRLAQLDNRPLPSFTIDEYVPWGYLNALPVMPPFKDAAGVTLTNAYWLLDLGSNNVYIVLPMGDDCGTPICTTPNILVCIEINRQLGLKNSDLASVDYQGLPNAGNATSSPYYRTGCYGDDSFGQPTLWYAVK